MERTEKSHDVWLRTRDDALMFVAAAQRRTVPGAATLVFAGPDGRVIDVFSFADGGELLPELAEFTCSPDEVDVTRLLLITDRTGQTPADRPDDELLWIELHASAAVGGVELLDWFVTYGRRWSFSIAEFAPIPAGW